MKKVFAVLLLFLLSFHQHAFAVVNPLSVPNNTFGIHIIDEHDLTDAALLVNGTGGSWGYITIVVTEQDRDTGKWQRIFDRMRTLKLIPVVRIATKPDGDTWERPDETDVNEWVSFFNSLNWVVQNRYVILFNEPNHAKEWGGTIQPEEYAHVAKRFRDALKESSDDYFVLPAGFDLAAGNTKETMNASSYFDAMYEADNEIFTLFDGWTSHSYPNPAFSGPVYGNGKQSIRGFEWELQYLFRYGLSEQAPVFITETGWAHEQGQSVKPQYFNTAQIADFYEAAFTDVWTHPSIVMVSPFILNYQGEPFDHFSWRKLGSDEFYDQYDRVKGLQKTAGMPLQINTFVLSTDRIPDTFMTNSFYLIPVVIKNTGQQIWDSTTGLHIQAVGAVGERKLSKRPVPQLGPTHEGIVYIPFKTPEKESPVPLVMAVTTADGTIVGDIVSKMVNIREPQSLWGQIMSYMSEN